MPEIFEIDIEDLVPKLQRYECGEARICASRLFDFAAFFGFEVEIFYQSMSLEVAQMSPACLISEDFKEYVKQPKKGFTADELELITLFRKLKETGEVKNMVQIFSNISKFVDREAELLAY